MPRPGGQREVGITPGFGENTHLRVDAAVHSIAGVCQREISVHKAVARLLPVPVDCQASMSKSKPVAEIGQYPPRVLCGIGLGITVV